MSDQLIDPPSVVTEDGDIPVTRPPRWSTGRRLVRLARANVPFLLVLLVAAAGLALILSYHWRRGSTVLGCALLLAALLRALLPDTQTGLIVVRRSRVMDVLTYAGLGALMVYVSLSITGGPLG